MATYSFIQPQGNKYPVRGDQPNRYYTKAEIDALLASAGGGGGGGGNVTKVGTPVNNQVGVWTGDGTLEGDAGFTYDKVNKEAVIDSTQVAPPTNLNFTYDLDPTNPYFQANGTDRYFAVYGRNSVTGYYDAVGASNNQTDSGDSDYYSISFSWDASSDADEYYLVDNLTGSYVNVGNVTSFFLDSTVSMTSGWSTLYKPWAKTPLTVKGDLVISGDSAVYAYRDISNNQYGYNFDTASGSLRFFTPPVGGNPANYFAFGTRAQTAPPSTYTEQMRLFTSGPNVGNLGLGTTNPLARLHAIRAGEQLRLGYDTTNYFKAIVNSVGNVSIDSFGSQPRFTFEDDVYAKSVASISSGTITRSGNLISSVALTGGKTINVTRSGNYISSFTDAVKTWTFTRNGSNQVTSWSVT